LFKIETDSEHGLEGIEEFNRVTSDSEEIFTTGKEGSG
jgi:hypothetical protein